MFNIFKKHKSPQQQTVTNHEHVWHLIATNDEYHSKDANTRKIEHWEQRFYQCSCGSRHHTDNYTMLIKHKGIVKAKNNWIDSGVVPAGSGHPINDPRYKLVDSLHEELSPFLAYQKTLEDIVNSLGVVINRNFSLENQYPNLKKAADEYHTQLEKYRNFETLKEKE